MADRGAIPDKIVYLAPRAAGLGDEEFIRLWRERGEWNMSLAAFKHFWHYEQGPKVTRDDQPALPELFDSGGQGAGPYSGVGASRFAGGMETIRELGKDPHGPTMDEGVFGGPIGPHVMLTRERVLRDHGATELKVFRFLARRDGVSPEEFSGRLEDQGIRLAADEAFTGHLVYFGLDHKVAGALEFDAVVELGFSGVDDLVAFYSEYGEDVGLADDDGFVDQSRALTILTAPAILHDETGSD